MKRPGLLSFVLSLLSGYVDTAVFVYMGGLFVAHVTGNFVLLGTTLSGHGLGNGHSDLVSLQLLSFPLFVVAAGLAAAITGKVGGGIAGTRTLLTLVAVVFAGVGTAFLAGWNIRIGGSLLLVMAMGLLNAAHRLDMTMGPPFTVMTGNVTGLAITLARLAHLAPKGVGGTKTSLAMTTLPIAGFLVGCASGALAQGYWGLGAMIGPALILGFALIVAV
jgi:uncharacterized membrane protein YoaK (UPF0700 family)